MWWHTIVWHKLVEAFFFDFLLPVLLIITITGMGFLLYQMFVRGDD